MSESDVDRNPYYGHWADHAARRASAVVPEGQPVVVAAGITPSGVVHVGNFREVMTVDLVARALRQRGREVRFIYSWDDFDVFRKVPKGMPRRELLHENLRRSVADVPDPYGEHDSYASHHIATFEASLARLGIEPEFIRQSRRYRAGEYAKGVRTALEARREIANILDRHRNEPLPESWLPLAGFCDGCGRDEIDFAWDGEWEVSTHCRSCGHDGVTDLRQGGNLKLPWRVDWPMRWGVEQVAFEPGGKDHSSAGGSYDTAREIVAHVYGGRAPEYVAYDFIRIKGDGGKISSSAGGAVTVADCLEIYEPEMLRWIFASVRPNSEFQISFDLDVLKLYEDYDRARRLAHEPEDGGKADKKRQVARRTMELASLGGRGITPGDPVPFVPPFRGLSTILMIYDGDIDRSLAHYEREGQVTCDAERELLRTRAGCAWAWTLSHAPPEFRYHIRSQPVRQVLDPEPRALLEKLVAFLTEHPDLDEATLIEHLKTLCDDSPLDPKTFYPFAYDLLIGRPKGPKLSTLISTMGVDRTLPLLRGGLSSERG